ncbi:MAG TPA: hypothetical protein VMA83_05860 [Solirubrobacteraceae bacterium]|nr:hypothetical protein [Solirubrobacteraceae bacterium]
MSSMGKRITWTTVLLVIVCALVALYINSYTSAWPKVITVTNVPATRTANLELQTVGAVGEKLDQKNPDWVSYLVRSHGEWVHTTIWQVPAHTLIHVTIYQYDSESGLRNPYLGQVQGTIGGVMTLNGKVVNQINPDSAAHSFAIPSMGVFVPLEGVNEEEAEKKHDFCEEAPCELSQAHNTISFSFRTGAPGHYRWQCFVPCGAGYTFGNGGPMSTLGYMGGFLYVV